MKLPVSIDQATATLHGLSTTEWVLLVLGVIVLLALAVIGFLWWRRRKAQPAAAPSPSETRSTGDIGKQLVADMRRFRRNLPAPARRCLDSFHPIVMLGTESSGKAAIIERFAGASPRRVE